MLPGHLLHVFLNDSSMYDILINLTYGVCGHTAITDQLAPYVHCRPPV